METTSDKGTDMGTCTIQNAVTGKCGQPGVRSWVGSDGTTYVECAEHDMGEPGPRVRSLQVGDHVEVRHVGLDKIGTVVEVKGSVVAVKVPIHDGTDTKIILRPLSSL